MSTAKDDAVIFISWSGEPSKHVARALHELLQSSIHTVNPWMSELDLDRGARWRSEIEKKLEQAKAGVIVVTADNQSAPWLLFESGALSKKNERVYTYLFQVQKPLADPLGQFHATFANREETLGMLKGINEELGDQGVDEGRMVKAFSQNWADFESKLTSIPAPSAPAPPPPSTTEMMQQALSYLREQSSDLAELKETVNSLDRLPRWPPSLGLSAASTLPFAQNIYEAMANTPSVPLGGAFDFAAKLRALGGHKADITTPSPSAKAILAGEQTTGTPVRAKRRRSYSRAAGKSAS